MNRYFALFVATIFVNALWALPLGAAMTGGDYEIPVDGFTMTGGEDGIGGDYVLSDTVGDPIADTLTGGDYELIGGFTGAANGGGLSMSLSKSTLTLDFGGSPLSTVATDSLVLTVTTDSATGYTASITESGDLASGANTIDDVSDGSVTAGAEEYGIQTSGDDGQLVADTAISGSVTVATRASAVTQGQTTVTFNAAAGQSTKAGSYSHTVTFTATVNP